MNFFAEGRRAVRAAVQAFRNPAVVELGEHAQLMANICAPSAAFMVFGCQVTDSGEVVPQWSNLSLQQRERIRKALGYTGTRANVGVSSAKAPR
jgi:hypothetical protein